MRIEWLRDQFARNARLIVLLAVTAALAVYSAQSGPSSAQEAQPLSQSMIASTLPGCPAPRPTPPKNGVILHTTPQNDPIMISSREARCEGQLSYNQRPAEVRAVMQRMYGNDAAYRTLTALFVDHTPADPVASIRIQIQQPNVLRAAIYTNDTGSGTPAQMLIDQGSQVESYLPAANVYMRSRVRSSAIPCKLPPLASVPLAESTGDCSSIVIQSPASTITDIANMFVHPASLLTSPFFNNKQVVLKRTTTFQGRLAYELQAVQSPLAPPLGALGDGWRMWVDTKTGIVLRLNYYSGTTLIGWGELRNVNIDGIGPRLDAAGTSLARWTLPADAQRVDPQAYIDQAHAQQP